MVSRPWLARSIRFAAGYSFSLFLIHFTIEKIIAAIWVGRPSWLGIAVAIVLSNLLSIVFAFATERHYRSVGAYLKQVWILRKPAAVMPS
jgi:peptidoglycan/LPS O-acetylase OafA/YrhL